MISIYTQVYNTRPFLDRTIKSVLNQTCSDFEYILIDNGSTDGCKELLEYYAERDERIKLIRFEENRHAPIWQKIALETGSGEYIVNLDSDDWLEETFLEKLLEVMKATDSDIVCTGTAFRIEGSEDMIAGTRSTAQRLVAGREQLSIYYPYYHAFFRTTWAKLIRRDVFCRTDYSKVESMTREKVFNGADTMTSFAWIRAAKRICVDNSILHNYLMRAQSVYNNYHPTRFASVTLLYEDAVEFLSRFGPISRENKRFIAIVYANGTLDALKVLDASNLSSEEKLTEYCRIAVHPVTQEMYRESDEAIERLCGILRQRILAAAGGGNKNELSDAVQTLFPQCGQAVAHPSAQIFQRDSGLTEALLRDDRDALIVGLMQNIVDKKYVKQYDLGGLLERLVPENNPMKGITDTRFFQNYTEICMLTLCENYYPAADQMTGMLLENQKLYQIKDFLRLYIRLAEQEGLESAVIFGKVRLAKEYLHENLHDECRVILTELTEMGVEDNEELMEMRRELGSPAHISAECGDVKQLVKLIEKQQQTIDALSQQVARLAESQGEWQRKFEGNMQQIMRTSAESAKNAEETMWAEIFNNTVSDSEWLVSKAFSPGRWAVGYSYLYAMYRVLNETRPKRILELGLGQSTRMLAQYAARYPDVKHTVVEHDPEWISFFKKSYDMPPQTKIVRLNRKMVSYKEAANVRVFDNFRKTFSGQVFDFISIDAPLSGDMTQYGRIDILSLLPGCLSKNFVIMMDDVNRTADARTAVEIQNKLNACHIPFAAGVYGGTSTCVLICAGHKAFLTSM